MFESSISLNSKEKGQLQSPTPENPPLYTVNASHDIPDINAGLSTLDLNTKKTRPISDLSAHLKLLESFHQLREDIALHDGLFGIWDSFVPFTPTEEEKAKILLKIREKRWAIYVAKATSRFETWWQASVEPGTGMLSTADLLIDYSRHLYVDEGDQLHFSKENLPPLGMYPTPRRFSLALMQPRRHHGVAFLLAEPSLFLGGLSSIQEDELLEERIASANY